MVKEGGWDILLGPSGSLWHRTPSDTPLCHSEETGVSRHRAAGTHSHPDPHGSPGTCRVLPALGMGMEPEPLRAGARSRREHEGPRG